MDHLPVLIVGAGPTGLMMACELARHGIEFRIIDKKDQPATGSNATWIQARTLEIFDSMGIIDPFLKFGHPCHAINFYDQGKCLANLSLKNINSTFPFILMLPQRDTERFLNEKLEKMKIHVERSLELINIEQINNKVISTIKQPNGNTETITSDWVIACDGANSTIREKCQLSFPGEDIPEQFMVADAKMSSFLPTDEIHVFFNKGTIFPEKATLFAAFPWSPDQYRLNANLYFETPRQTYHEHEVKEMVAERAYGNFTIESVSWISPFWIHGRLVNEMQLNSIFILGDAAHLHSPAGGQGMNTGIQDAYNLAWKLALVIKHKAKPGLLKSFQSERYSVIKNIVDKTNSLTNSVLFDKHFFHELRTFSKTLLKKGQTEKMADELTQLSITYKNSPIIDYDLKPPKHSPKQGERAPNIKMNHSKTLYDYFSDNQHTILIFIGKGKNITENLIKIRENLLMKFSDIAKIIFISNENAEEENVIADKNYHVHDAYHITNTAIYIIRPDNYISYFSEELNVKNIEMFFKKVY